MSIFNSLYKKITEKVYSELENRIKENIEYKSLLVNTNQDLNQVISKLFGSDSAFRAEINYMVYACISYTTTETSKVRLLLKKNGIVDYNNEIATKLLILNPLYSSFSDFIEHIVLLLIKDGICYILNDKTYFVVYKKDDVKVEYDQKTKYPLTYEINNKKYKDNQVITIKIINNPDDINEPIPILKSIEDVTKLTNEGIKFLTNFFKEGGFISGFFKSTNEDNVAIGNYDPAKEELLFRRVMQRIKEGKAGIIPPNYEFISAGSSMKDTMTIEIMKHIENIIATSFKIPKTILGKLVSGGSYSLTNVERKLFYDIVIDGYISKIEGAFTTYLKRYYDISYSVERDITKLNYLKYYILDYSTQISQLVGSGVLTVNEAREKFFDLPPLEDEEVNVIEVPLNNSNQIEGDRENPLREGDEYRNPKSLQKSINEDDINEDIVQEERNFINYIKKYLFPVLRDLQTEIRFFISEDIVKSISIDLSIYGKENFTKETFNVDLIINPEKRNELKEKFGKILEKYYKRLIKRSERILSLYYEFDENIEILEKYKEKIEQFRKKSEEWFEKDIILGIIFKTLDELDNYIYEEYINLLMQNFIELSSSIAKIWSYTETMRTLNERIFDYGISENKLRNIYKAWRSMRDERVREPHREVDNDLYIPFDKKFELHSGKATYYADRPYDPTLPPELVINCRCFLLLKVIDE